MCPKGSGPHSAAKQGRSFRVPLRRSRPHSAAKQGRSFRVTRPHLGKGSPRDRPPAQSKTHILRKDFNVAKSGLDLQIPKWTGWAGGS